MRVDTNALISSALPFTSATRVAVLESLIPVVTRLIGERCRPLQWGGVVSLGGALVMITAGRAGP